MHQTRTSVRLVTNTTIQILCSHWRIRSYIRYITQSAAVWYSLIKNSANYTDAAHVGQNPNTLNSQNVLWRRDPLSNVKQKKQSGVYMKKNCSFAIIAAYQPASTSPPNSLQDSKNIQQSDKSELAPYVTIVETRAALLAAFCLPFREKFWWLSTASSSCTASDLPPYALILWLTFEKNTVKATIKNDNLVVWKNFNKAHKRVTTATLTQERAYFCFLANTTNQCNVYLAPNFSNYCLERALIVLVIFTNIFQTLCSAARWWDLLFHSEDTAAVALLFREIWTLKFFFTLFPDHIKTGRADKISIRILAVWQITRAPENDLIPFRKMILSPARTELIACSVVKMPYNAHFCSSHYQIKTFQQELQSTAIRCAVNNLRSW